MNNYLKINMKSKILPEYAEKLEDELLKFFTEKDIIVDIFDSVTGNNTQNYNKARNKRAQFTTGYIEKWLGTRFTSSYYSTKQWESFLKDFKHAIKNSLPEGSRLVNWLKGHFEVSGFIVRNNKYVYFSISDVRYWQDEWYHKILIRTASGPEDYMGGSNNYTDLPHFKGNVEKLLERGE